MASLMDGNPALKELYDDLKRRMDQAVAAFPGQPGLHAHRPRQRAHARPVKVDYYGTSHAD